MNRYKLDTILKTMFNTAVSELNAYLAKLQDNHPDKAKIVPITAAIKNHAISTTEQLLTNLTRIHEPSVGLTACINQIRKKVTASLNKNVNSSLIHHGLGQNVLTFAGEYSPQLFRTILDTAIALNDDVALANIIKNFANWWKRHYHEDQKILTHISEQFIAVYEAASKINDIRRRTETIRNILVILSNPHEEITKPLSNYIFYQSSLAVRLMHQLYQLNRSNSNDKAIQKALWVFLKYQSRVSILWRIKKSDTLGQSEKIEILKAILDSNNIIGQRFITSGNLLYRFSTEMHQNAISEILFKASEYLRTLDTSYNDNVINEYDSLIAEFDDICASPNPPVSSPYSSSTDVQPVASAPAASVPCSSTDYPSAPPLSLIQSNITVRPELELPPVPTSSDLIGPASSSSSNTSTLALYSIFDNSSDNSSDGDKEIFIYVPESSTP